MLQPDWKDSTSVESFLKELVVKTAAKISKEDDKKVDYYACATGFTGVCWRVYC